ncbi:MAG: hypothetical protein METHP_00810 [Methanoregula sp. SKADARSKE-2]|nr:MAG: hypothetical protein METHP_00810 [Methanoregula sp. SKADARSKE-2]
MKGSVKLLSLIGVLLFIFILTRINLGETVAIFLKANTLILVLAVVVNFSAIFFKSLKWKIIVNSIRPDFPITESVKAFFVGFSFSTITPAKIGDFVRALYIRDERCGLGKCLSTVVIDRLIDILLLFSVALIAILGFSAFYRIEVLSIGTILLIIAGIVTGTLVILNKPVLSLLLKPFFTMFVPEHLKSTFSGYYHDFFSGLFIFYADRRRFFGSITAGVISWIPPFVYGYLLAVALGINIGFLFFFLVIPVISLLDLLPISISGIGTRDVALIFLFGLQGISPEQAIAFSLVYLFLSYWFIALIGVGVYLKFPIQIPKAWR